MTTRKTGNPLTLREWWDEVGTENVTKVAARVGTSLAYMRCFRYRTKRPGYDLAKQIIVAANQITTGFTPDLDLMMLPVAKRKPNPDYTPVIQPSARFKSVKGVKA